MQTQQTSQEENPTSYTKDVIIGLVILGLLAFVGISVFTIESSEMILSFPVFALTIIAIAVAAGTFIAAISKVRQKSLAMDVRFMTVLFDVGALQQQLAPVANGNVTNGALDAGEVAKEIEDLAAKVKDIASEAKDLVKLLPWWLEGIKGAVLLLDIIAVVAAILALTPPVTLVGVLVLIAAIIALIATIAWIVSQLNEEAYERGKLDQKQADLEKMQEELKEKIRKLAS
jgi:hypothetical protein